MLAFKILKTAVFAFAFTALSAIQASADAPGTPPLKRDPQPQVSVHTWGTAHPDCAEWTDACTVCQRNEAGAAHCSTPGIACLPKGITCARQVSPKK